METKFYYIHGLYGSKKSRKFLDLQKQFSNIECLDWNFDDTIEEKLQEWEKIIVLNNYENTCIIASSTGGNFAVQLRNRLKPIFFHLVLINPLLNVDYLFENSIMPEILKPALAKFDQLKESLILLSIQDSVINNVKFIEDNDSIKNWNKIIIDQHASHQFETLNLYYKEIDLLVNSLYL